MDFVCLVDNWLLVFLSWPPMHAGWVKHALTMSSRLWSLFRWPHQFIGRFHMVRRKWWIWETGRCRWYSDPVETVGWHNRRGCHFGGDSHSFPNLGKWWTQAFEVIKVLKGAHRFLDIIEVYKSIKAFMWWYVGKDLITTAYLITFSGAFREEELVAA